jgi:hypothetical protein
MGGLDREREGGWVIAGGDDVPSEEGLETGSRRRGPKLVAETAHPKGSPAKADGQQGHDLRDSPAMHRDKIGAAAAGVL